MATDHTAASASIWCVYSHDPKASGPTYVKHPAEGPTMLGFGSQILAEKFIRGCQLPPSSVAALISQLGTAAFPNPAGWLQTDKVMLIDTIEELRAFGLDREAFVSCAVRVTVPIRYGPAVDPS